jgi:4-hydroxyphenylpyruvate dioxygenase-like putative hemolysin
MALNHVIGVDHVVVAVRDLARSARAWETLGFVVSPRGLHSPQLGTANHTIMLQDDYIELLSPVAETEQNLPTREFLMRREGVERVAFTTDDADAGAAEIAARGFPALGPIHFGRPVPRPGGGETEARFSVFRWPLAERPAGLRIFACQHHTRDAVWASELMTHPNGALAMRAIEIVAADPAAAAAHLARLIDRPAERDGRRWRVVSGQARADFIFADAAAYESFYPAKAREGAPSEGVIALRLAVRDLDAAVAASGAIRHGEGASAPAARADGVILHFVPA